MMLTVLMVTSCSSSPGSSVQSFPTTVVRAASTTSAATTPSTSVTVTTVAQPDTGGRALPVSVSALLSSSQQDPTILLPSSCDVDAGMVTVHGSFNGGFVPEAYRRFGDVVELYAYSSNDDPPTGNDLQVLDLGAEKPGSMDTAGNTWTAVAPVDGQVGQPLHCFVAVQSTHAFMGAGNAGG